MFVRSVTFIIVGLLAAVNLTLAVNDSTVYLDWTASFSLDITGVSHDTSYCVDVTNAASSLILYSQCGITMTEFTYPLPPDRICSIILFTVTPVNLAGNGVRNTVSYIEDTDCK